MIPLLTTCCCGYICVKSGALILGGVQAVAAIVHLVINILIVSGAMKAFYDGSLTIDFMIVDIIGLIVNILLIVGIEKRMPMLVLPAVIHYMAGAAITFGLMCTGLFMAAGRYLDTVLLGVGPVVIGICLYFWLIVYSYYRLMKNESLASNVGLEASLLANEPMLGD